MGPTHPLSRFRWGERSYRVGQRRRHQERSPKQTRAPASTRILPRLTLLQPHRGGLCTGGLGLLVLHLFENVQGRNHISLDRAKSLGQEWRRRSERTRMRALAEAALLLILGRSPGAEPAPRETPAPDPASGSRPWLPPGGPCLRPPWRALPQSGKCSRAGAPEVGEQPAEPETCGVPPSCAGKLGAPHPRLPPELEAGATGRLSAPPADCAGRGQCHLPGEAPFQKAERRKACVPGPRLPVSERNLQNERKTSLAGRKHWSAFPLTGIWPRRGTEAPARAASPFADPPRPRATPEIRSPNGSTA